MGRIERGQSEVGAVLARLRFLSHFDAYEVPGCTAEEDRFLDCVLLKGDFCNTRVVSKRSSSEFTLRQELTVLLTLIIFSRQLADRLPIVIKLVVQAMLAKLALIQLEQLVGDEWHPWGPGIALDKITNGSSRADVRQPKTSVLGVQNINA